ncbi:MAG: tetratricopeptide repeat protein, partial [Clostridia bacterium]|nr:tetratricopeptide repeat protein [Clostridia bacterium]
MKDNVMGYETLSWIIDSSQRGFFAVTASPAMQRVILSHYNYSSILIFDYSKKKHPFDYSKLSKELSKKKNKDIRTCFIFNFQLAVDTEDDLIRLNHSRDMLAGENKNLVFFMDENTYRKINLEARDFFSYFQLKLEFEDEGVLPIGKEDFDFNYTGAQGTDTAEPIAIDFNKPKEELLARAIALSNRATALVNNGEYAKAKAALEAVVKIRERLLGEEHPDTAGSYNNIAEVYYAKGEYDHALEYCEKALAIYEKVLGNEHPSTAESYGNIAGVYYAKGEYDRALEYNEKVLAIREKVLGREHPDTATSYNNIAGVYYAKGEYDHA